MKLLKKSLLSMTIASAIAAPFAASQAANIGTFSANVALTTDYYFRGISQTNNDGAIQGGFDWAHDTGFYAGVWASNVAFGDTNLETDTYLGFSRDTSFGMNYDIGVIKYNYNNTSSSDDPVEFYGSLGYSFFSVGYAYSNDWFGSGDSSNYTYLGFDYGLPYDIGLTASVGYSWGDAYKVSDGKDYDYVDYKVGINKDYWGVNWDLSYVGNNLGNTQCNNYGYATSNCDARFILTASKAIDDTMQPADGMPISANVALTTDYYFRGISQTDNDGAIQGGFDYEHSSGFYAGLWGSNVAFGDTNLELDTYLGFANETGYGMSYDIGVIKYNYNNTDSSDDPLEFYGSLGYSFFTAGYAYSNDWFGSGDASNYGYLSFDYGLPYEIGMAASVGYSWGAAYKSDDVNFEYVDYKVGVNKDFVGVNWDLSYVGNNLSDKKCDAYGYASSNCDDRFILTASKSF